MPAANAVDILRRFEFLSREADMFRPLWQEIADYQFPRRTSVLRKLSPGARRTTKMFDGTAQRAAILLASTIAGTLTPDTMKWFNITSRNGDLRKSKEFGLWADECAGRMFSGFQQSNLSAELHEVYLDCPVFGTGSIYADEKPGGKGDFFNGFRFQAQEIGTYVIAEDASGVVDTNQRMLTMSARAAVGRFKNKVGEKLMQVYRDRPDENVKILHSVYPREGGEYGSSNKKKPFASCYVYEAEKYLIEESGYDENPFADPRWSKVSGETWGFGPGFVAQPDVRTLNEAVKQNLKALAKAAAPPVMARHDGIIGTPKLAPDSIIDVYDMESLQTLDLKSRFDVTMIARDALQNDIRNTYFWEQLQLPGQQMYTATEVERRLEIMQRVLGPTLGRFNTELLLPLIARCFGMLLRAGMRSKWRDPAALPQPPGIVLEALRAGVEELDIEFVGPLARAQQASDLGSVERAYMLSAPVLQIDPDAAAVYNGEKTIRFIARRAGLPAELLNDEDEVKAIRQAKTEARQQMAQTDQMTQMAEAAGKFAPAMKAASDLQQVPQPGVPTAA